MTADAVETDFRLARAAQAGDRRAFERLVGLHKAALYRLVRRYVGDADDAYDLTQEAFIAAWLALPRFDPRQSFAPWLRAIALNKCRDFARRVNVRRRMLALFAQDPTSPQPAGAEQAGASAERRQQLDCAIARLPAKYREPLLLTAVSGLTQGEAAQELGLTEKAVEMRIRRAKRRLVEALSVHPRKTSEG